MGTEGTRGIGGTERLYLRGALFVVRMRRNEYMMVRPGSGTTTPTDSLGAWAARQLIRGQSVGAVGAALARKQPGREEAYANFLTALTNLGALGEQSPRARRGWQARMLASVMIGALLSMLPVLLPLLPVWALVWSFRVLPRRLARRTIGQTFSYTDANLRSAGYADKTPAWRARVAAAASEATVRVYLFTFLGLVLSQRKLERLLRRLIDAESLVALESELRAWPGGVLSGLHTDGSAVLSIYLALRGYPLAYIADMKMADARLGTEPQKLPAWAGTIIDNAVPDARAQLQRHVEAGKFAYMLFDTPNRDTSGGSYPTTRFMGRTVRRFFGPAWLAVHTGLPVIFATTHYDGKRFVVSNPAVLTIGLASDQRAQIGQITDYLYTLGEKAIRKYPEAWTCWSYLHAFEVPVSQQPQQPQQAAAQV